MRVRVDLPALVGRQRLQDLLVPLIEVEVLVSVMRGGCWVEHRHWEHIALTVEVSAVHLVWLQAGVHGRR